jgi:hypothetical protein
LVVDRNLVVSEVAGHSVDSGANAGPLVALLEKLQDTGYGVAPDGAADQVGGFIEVESAVNQQQRDRQRWP